MSSLMAAGLQLMLIGMGTVFFFLTLLVLATRLMSAIALRVAPSPQAESVAPGGEISADEVAAITAAVARFRQKKPPGRQAVDSRS